MAGITCAADAPLPTIATRLSESSSSSGQLLVWKLAPLNLSLPGKFGITGMDKGPVALIIYFAYIAGLLFIAMHHCRRSSSHLLLMTS